MAFLILTEVKNTVLRTESSRLGFEFAVAQLAQFFTQAYV